MTVVQCYRGQYSDYLELDNMLSGTIRLAKTLDYETLQVIRGIVIMLMFVGFVNLVTAGV